MIPAARKFDAKKEVDTARRRAYLFFVAFFRGAFSVDHTPAPPRPRPAAAPRRADDAPRR